MGQCWFGHGPFYASGEKKAEPKSPTLPRPFITKRLCFCFGKWGVVVCRKGLQQGHRLGDPNTPAAVSEWFAPPLVPRRRPSMASLEASGWRPRWCPLKLSPAGPPPAGGRTVTSGHTTGCLPVRPGPATEPLQGLVPAGNTTMATPTWLGSALRCKLKSGYKGAKLGNKKL